MTQTAKKSPLLLFFVFSLVLLVLLVGYSFVNDHLPGSRAPSELIGVLRPQPKDLQSFELIDQEGRPFGRSQLEGKWSFLFFGFASCPDVCPMTLTILKSVEQALAERGRAEDIQVLFVSVDPQRDSPESLAEYIRFFNPDFRALTGTKAQLDKFSRQIGAGYIIEPETSPGVYNVKHTSAIFLLDPKARLVAVFSQPHTPQTIVSQYQQIRAYLD